ncbi:MAG: hypothetical protein U9Q99_02595 [Nanoarchaeota archaeon]|nr:hypothetical protein [Nanoarchaeota archaeon]
MTKKKVVKKKIHSNASKKTYLKKGHKTGSSAYSKTRNSRVKKDVRPATEKILIDNFVSMQKILVHLTEKFSDLTNRIDDLLNMFEGAAKSVINKEFHPIDEKSKRELITKIDAILEQNKLLAKGLTLIHDTATDPNINYAIGSNEVNIPRRLGNNPPKKRIVKESSEPFNKFQ